MLETVVLTHYTSPLLTPTVHAVQSDTGRILVCKVTDFVIPEGAIARFRARKPDDKLIFNIAKIVGRTIRVELTSQLLAAFGTVRCNIEILHNEKTLRSFEFSIEVNRLLVTDLDIESTNEFSYLDSVVDSANNALIKANEAISTAETAAANANQKAEYANDKGDYARIQGDYAKTQGVYAKTHGEAAQAAATEAKTNSELANAAAQSAATQSNYAKEQGDYAKTHGEAAQASAQEATAAAQAANEKAESAQLQGDYAKVQGQGAENAKVQAESAARSAAAAAQSANQAAVRANSAAEICENIAAGVGNRADLITFNDDNSSLGANNVQAAIDKIVEKVGGIDLRSREYKDTMDAHIASGINAAEGVHDLKFYNGEFSTRQSGEWVTVEQGNDFFNENESTETEFKANGEIHVTSAKYIKKTVFETDGSVTERLYKKDGLVQVYSKNTRFQANGNIQEVIQ